jgi:hypothetical protein
MKIQKGGLIGTSGRDAAGRCRNFDVRDGACRSPIDGRDSDVRQMQCNLPCRYGTR